MNRNLYYVFKSMLYSKYSYYMHKIVHSIYFCIIRIEVMMLWILTLEYFFELIFSFDIGVFF